jgi:hypothetical protein
LPRPSIVLARPTVLLRLPVSALMALFHWLIGAEVT